MAGGHTTDASATLTYSSVVSRDSVRIALTIAALNRLEVMACDIRNAYLTAEKRFGVELALNLGQSQARFCLSIRHYMV